MPANEKRQPAPRLVPMHLASLQRVTKSLTLRLNQHQARAGLFGQTEEEIRESTRIRREFNNERESNARLTVELKENDESE